MPPADLAGEIKSGRRSPKEPITTKFNEIRILTGTFNSSQKFRFLNTEKFFVLFNAGKSQIPPEMVLYYMRYGNPYQIDSPEPEKPIRKGTVHKVTCREENPTIILMKLKEAIRMTAKTYCPANRIEFNESIPTNEMVIFHDIFQCPFEWPQAEICVSIDHSVFVSGMMIGPEEQSGIDYELTSDHLREMWAETDLPEIEGLGITVFTLPEASNAITWWVIAIGIAVLTSLVTIFVFWKLERHHKEDR